MRLLSLAALIAIVSCFAYFWTVQAPPSVEAVNLAEIAEIAQLEPVVLPTPTPFLPAVATPDNRLISLPLPRLTPTPGFTPTAAPPILYYSQGGDTLPLLVKRFAVRADEITSPDPVPSQALINPGQLFIIPNRLVDISSSKQLMPDSESIFSPSTVDFDVDAFVSKAGGRLSQYSEFLATTGNTSGAQVIKRVALEFSINPRLLLSLLEYQSHWVYGQPANLAQVDYPMGLVDNQHKGLYQQLTWTVSQLSAGYYGWREGTLLSLTFPDGSTLRLAPELNAGTVALQSFFAYFDNLPAWAGALYGTESLPALHERMFGNPWVRAHQVEPLLPANLTQPQMSMPFAPDEQWSFSGGPHAAWGAAGARAALDFAPGGIAHGCFKAYNFVRASASGLVVRSEHNVVVIDLDGDGHEATGWEILYMHIAEEGHIPVGTRVAAGDPIGHPSCEGGVATGTHVHVARKYNGEWVLADGPIPFVLSGWQAHAGVNPYDGTLTQGDQTVTASPLGAASSVIILPHSGP